MAKKQKAFQSNKEALEYREQLLDENIPDAYLPVKIAKKIAKAATDEEWIAFVMEDGEPPTIKLSSKELSVLLGGKATVTERFKNDLHAFHILKSHDSINKEKSTNQKLAQIDNMAYKCRVFTPGQSLFASTWVTNAEAVCNGYGNKMKQPKK